MARNRRQKPRDHRDPKQETQAAQIIALQNQVSLHHQHLNQMVLSGGTGGVDPIPDPNWYLASWSMSPPLPV